MANQYGGGYDAEEMEAVAGWLREGLSASQISDRFTIRFDRYKSRNAIIGLVHRTKALADIGFERQAVGQKGPRKPRAERPARKVRGKFAWGSDFGKAANAAAPVDRLFADVAAAAQPARQEIAVPPIGFLDAIMQDRCLFFAGDPHSPPGPGMPVCGAERAAGEAETRYCRKHMVRSIGRGSPAERAAPAVLRRAMA